MKGGASRCSLRAQKTFRMRLPGPEQRAWLKQRAHPVATWSKNWKAYDCATRFPTCTANPARAVLRDVRRRRRAGGTGPLALFACASSTLRTAQKSELTGRGSGGVLPRFGKQDYCLHTICNLAMHAEQLLSSKHLARCGFGKRDRLQHFCMDTIFTQKRDRRLHYVARSSWTTVARRHEPSDSVKTRWWNRSKDGR